MSSNGTGSPSEELSRKSMDATYLLQLRTLKAFAKEVESVVDAYVPHAAWLSSSIATEERRVYEVVVVMKQLFQHLEESLAPIDHTHGRCLVLSRSARF